jgi:hypothetical protein
LSLNRIKPQTAPAHHLVTTPTMLSWHETKYSAFGKSLYTYKKVLEVMSTCVYTGLNPFNFIFKHFLQICLWDVSYEHSYCSF